MKLTRSLAADMFVLFGAAALIAGMFLAWQPLGWIGAGLVCVAIGLTLVRR